MGRLLALVALSAVACREPLAEVGDTGTETGAESATTGALPDTTEDAGTSTGVADSSGGDVEYDGIPAGGGVEIDRIEINQGVGVALAIDGEAVAPADRSAALVAGRPALVRVSWSIPEWWEPRDIEARLSLESNDGDVVEYSDLKSVATDSAFGTLAQTFNFELAAEEVAPGMRYAVELYEGGEAVDSPAMSPPRVPADPERAELGIDDAAMNLHVVIVPFAYDDGMGCATEPDLSDATMQLYADKLFQMNPVQALDIEIHETIAWDGTLENLLLVNFFLSDLRAAEDAAPETYYFGTIDVCAPTLGGVSGLAYGIPEAPDEANAFRRVATGLSVHHDHASDIFVHEIGHSQGRRHVTCTGGEDGAVVDYPFEGGDIGDWGYGVLDGQLRHPTASKDYMSYCAPVWTSAFGWNETYAAIRTLSAWGGERGQSRGRVLVGALRANGDEHWSIVPGRVERLTEEIEIVLRIDGVEERRGTNMQRIGESGDRLVVAPLPAAAETVDVVARITDGVRTTVRREGLTTPSPR
ncbi:MAG: hypothetical protein AAF721_05930 [Myxococcota bacterium]